MKKSRFSEEQIIGMIKEQEGGVPTAEVCASPSLGSTAAALRLTAAKSRSADLDHHFALGTNVCHMQMAALRDEV